jgi:hypothetical protein
VGCRTPCIFAVEPLNANRNSAFPLRFKSSSVSHVRPVDLHSLSVFKESHCIVDSYLAFKKLSVAVEFDCLSPSS